MYPWAVGETGNNVEPLGLNFEGSLVYMAGLFHDGK